MVYLNINSTMYLHFLKFFLFSLMVGLVGWWVAWPSFFRPLMSVFG